MDKKLASRFFAIDLCVQLVSLAAQNVLQVSPERYVKTIITGSFACKISVDSIYKRICNYHWMISSGTIKWGRSRGMDFFINRASLSSFLMGKKLKAMTLGNNLGYIRDYCVITLETAVNKVMTFINLFGAVRSLQSS